MTLYYGDRVKLVKLPEDSGMNGLEGIVVGVSVLDIMNTYIIEMDAFPTKEIPWKCITITEACLELLEN